MSVSDTKRDAYLELIRTATADEKTAWYVEYCHQQGVGTDDSEIDTVKTESFHEDSMRDYREVNPDEEDITQKYATFLQKRREPSGPARGTVDSDTTIQGSTDSISQVPTASSTDTASQVSTGANNDVSQVPTASSTDSVAHVPTASSTDTASQVPTGANNDVLRSFETEYEQSRDNKNATTQVTLTTATEGTVSTTTYTVPGANDKVTPLAKTSTQVNISVPTHLHFLRATDVPSPEPSDTEDYDADIPKWKNGQLVGPEESGSEDEVLQHESETDPLHALKEFNRESEDRPNKADFDLHIQEPVESDFDLHTQAGEDPFIALEAFNDIVTRLQLPTRAEAQDFTGPDGSSNFNHELTEPQRENFTRNVFILKTALKELFENSDKKGYFSSVWNHIDDIRPLIPPLFPKNN